ncbi:MAG: glycosyltransferase family 2 protein [Planctomycetales bacterium]|nr:glycosyltransferase family 2 protein [Planctomycetales bacterium]
MRSPRATIAVLSCGGREALRPALESALEQRLPAGEVEVLLVDQASPDATGDWVERELPAVRVLRPGRNTGCAGGRNLAAREARGEEFLAFLDDDAEAEPGWLGALAAALEADPAVAAAGSAVLDAGGRKVEFAGPLASLVGHSWQEGKGERRETLAAPGPFPVLFPAGGAMAVRRDAFLEAGGFDESFGIYFEDLDLGWRLWVLGRRVLLVPAAAIRHRVHGTMGGVDLSRRIFLHERNALRALWKNAGDEWLDRALPAALLLALQRAAVHVPRPPEDFVPDPTASALPDEPLPTAREGLASLFAVEGFARDLPTLVPARAAVQSRRKRPDREILPLFRAPFAVHPIGSGYEEPAAEALEALCGDLVPPSRRPAPVATA